MSASWMDRAEAEWRSQEAAASGTSVVILACGHTAPVPAIGGQHGWCIEHGVQPFAAADETTAVGTSRRDGGLASG